MRTIPRSILLCLAVWTSSSQATMGSGFAEERDGIAPPIVGGYAPAKIDDPMVVEAAEFAVKSLASSKYLFADAALIESFKPRIVQASQQVVAGMNYKLLVMIHNEGPEEDVVCFGAFFVTIYNQFGNLSVTNWGREYSCEESYEILEKIEQS